MERKVTSVGGRSGSDRRKPSPAVAGAEGRKGSSGPLPGTLVLGEGPRRRGWSAEEVQDLLGRVAARLGQVRAVLVEIRDGLPVPGEGSGGLEAGISQDLADELRGTIECVVEEDLDSATEQLVAACALTAADLARRAGERAEDERATRRLADRIAPRVAEILAGGVPPSRRHRRAGCR